MSKQLHKGRKVKTTAERILEIQLLLNHPAGVCENWTKKLVLELKELQSESKYVPTQM